MVEVGLGELFGDQGFVELENVGPEGAELGELLAVGQCVRSHPEELPENLDLE